VTLATPPIPPIGIKLKGLGFASQNAKSGVWGQSKKLSLWGFSPKDCESFLRAPIVNKNSRAASDPRERSGVQTPRACSIPPPIPPGDQIERPSFRFAERSFFLNGGLGAERKTQSIGRSPIDCESFLRAPIVNKNSRAASVPRERSGVQITASAINPNPHKSPRALSIRTPTNHRERYQSEPPQITASAFNSEFFKPISVRAGLVNQGRRRGMSGNSAGGTCESIARIPAAPARAFSSSGATAAFSSRSS